MRRVRLRVEEAESVSISSPKKVPLGTRDYQVSNRGGLSANNTGFGAGHVAVVATITAARRDGSPPHGPVVGPSQSGIVDMSRGGGT